MSINMSFKQHIQIIKYSELTIMIIFIISVVVILLNTGYLLISDVKQLITSRIKKNIYIIYVYCIYLLCVYKYTHTVYILKIFTCIFYIIYLIFKHNIFVIYIYMHVFVFIYTHNKYTQYTYIM